MKIKTLLYTVALTAFAAAGLSQAASAQSAPAFFASAKDFTLSETNEIFLAKPYGYGHSPRLLNKTSALGETTNLGVMLGGNFSWLRNNGNLESTPVAGILLGGFFRWSPSIIYLQPELLYSARGANVELSVNQNGGGNVDSEVRLRHLDLPVMVGLNLINGETFKLRLHGGPVVSFLLNANDEIIDDYYGDLDSDGRVEQASELYAPFQLGWQAGVGADFGNFTFDARYESSFSDFRSADGKDQVYDESELMNQNIRLSVGFMIF